jgi:hypothetical protein
MRFQNNPRHRTVLLNELLGTRLAKRTGLPTTPVVEVSEELIALTPELAVEMPSVSIFRCSGHSATAGPRQVASAPRHC